MPISGKANVRFYHGAYSVLQFITRSNSYCVLEPGQLLEPEYKSIDAGMFNLEIYLGGNFYNNRTRIMGPTSIDLTDGGIYTIIFSGIIPVHILI